MTRDKGIFAEPVLRIHLQSLATITAKKDLHGHNYRMSRHVLDHTMIGTDTF